MSSLAVSNGPLAGLATVEAQLTEADAAGAGDSFARRSRSVRGLERAGGTTAKTVVGDGSGSFVARRDFFVALKLPRVATEGNTLQMGVSVHNLGGRDREVELNVHSAISGQSDGLDGSDRSNKKTDTKKLTVKAHATETVPVERKISAGEKLRIEAEAKEVKSEKSDRSDRSDRSDKREKGPLAGLASDKVVRVIPIRSWGIEVSDSEGGKAHDSLAVTLQLPTGRTYTDRSIEVAVGPVIEEALFHLPPMGFGAANTTLASRVLASAALVDYLGRTGERDTPIAIERSWPSSSSWPGSSPRRAATTATGHLPTTSSRAIPMSRRFRSMRWRGPRRSA